MVGQIFKLGLGQEILINKSIFYDNVITNRNKPSGSSLLHYIF